MRKIKGWIYILLILDILCGACNSPTPTDPDHSVIKGNIEYPSARMIYLFSFADSNAKYSGIRTPIDSAIIDKHGDYVFSFKLKECSVCDLRIGEKMVEPNLFLCKGETLTINFTEKENKPLITGDDITAKQNNYLQKFLQKFYSDPEVKQFYYISSNYLPVTEYSAYMEKRRNEQKTFYDEFFRSNKPEKEFADYATSEIEYQNAADKLMCVWKKRMKGEDATQDSTYDRLSDRSFLENSRAVKSPAYFHFLTLYVSDIYERLLAERKIPKNATDRLDPLYEKRNIASEYLNGIARDIVLRNLNHRN